MFRRLFFGLFAVVASASFIALLVGCGNSGEFPTYPAGGKVTFSDGTPLTQGWVTFESTDPGRAVSARGQLQSDGTFTLGTFEPGDGAIEGEHRVLVAVPTPEGDDPVAMRAPPLIDPKFSRFETSGLEFTVSDDGAKNQFEIVVEKPGR